MKSAYFSEEHQYNHVLKTIMTSAENKIGRNGEVKSIFGEYMRFSLENNTIPILTAKRVAWKTCLRELLWFIHGGTNVKELHEKNVHIWDGNSTREFLDSRGLYDYEEGELGPIYGYQWRHFNKPYEAEVEVEAEVEADQLQYIITQLKDPVNKFSRRLIMTAWNPLQIKQMALPPCHVMCQFNVSDGNKLSCALFQRSCDMICGVPFNIASYAFLTHLLAHHCNLIAKDLVYFMGDVHVYKEHYGVATELLERYINNQYEIFPTIEISTSRENIDDYIEEDFIIHNYKHCGDLKAIMVA